ncbi:MAG: DNA gyrase C-terminal beta-propeller domain-containing protein, partial [Anaerolineales bacterium]
GANMSESILSNHYIGSGVMLPADQTFHVALCTSQDQLVLVSHQGYLLRLQASQVSHAIHEAMRLDKTDHLVSAFLVSPGQSILAATQGGKLVLRTEDSFETAESFKTKGKPLFSQSRREQGVRVVGAAALSEADWGAALDASGQLTVHSMADLFASGTIPMQDELLAFAPLLFARAGGQPSSEG